MGTRTGERPHPISAVRAADALFSPVATDAPTLSLRASETQLIYLEDGLTKHCRRFYFTRNEAMITSITNHNRHWSSQI